MPVLDLTLLLARINIAIEKGRDSLENESDSVQAATHRGRVKGLRYVLGVIEDLTSTDEEDD